MFFQFEVGCVWAAARGYGLGVEFSIVQYNPRSDEGEPKDRAFGRRSSGAASESLDARDGPRGNPKRMLPQLGSGISIRLIALTFSFQRHSYTASRMAFRARWRRTRVAPSLLFIHFATSEVGMSSTTLRRITSW